MSLRLLFVSPTATPNFPSDGGEHSSPPNRSSTYPRSPVTEHAVEAPMQGTIVSVDVRPGDTVRAGQQLVVIESMKMEHVIAAEEGGEVVDVLVAAGQTVEPGDVLVRVAPRAGAADAVVGVGVGGVAGVAGVASETGDRADLAEVVERHAVTRDERRPEAVARRRATGQRTARENVEDLCDPGSYVEYGALAIAAQRRRRTVEDLIARTPADGLVAGIGTVHGHRTIVMSYDYTVLAGTQGLQNHRKKDRLFELAEELRLPIVFFTEGGGGRPGDTDGTGVSGLDCLAFALFGGLSGLVPLVGVNSGRCFAGNAAILGCCDVVIATADSNIGMGGPAMIEGGGLGVYEPDDIGPMSVQAANGVVDVAVADEAEAVAVARRYLSYFQGPTEQWACSDQARLRTLVPENRMRAYDVRAVVDGLADTGSVLELRPGFGPGMMTALTRVEGRPLGVIANNPSHLGGAIDADGGDKAARFMQLCDAFDLPILFLCDTPGIMVGPEAEKTALVRHVSRMFVTGASITVPFFTIVLRKGYGLGAQAMAGGSFKAPVFTVAWPTGEFGGMGLEGAVKLGFRRELDAVEDAGERQALFEEMVARMYEHGKALNAATYFEIDDVIDPAETRTWVSAAVRAAAPIERG
ncbi:MAG: carbamoyl-phosphate synthase large subunit, partial [Acidimicrobiia bacterium]|nr:carbamoyl-phosphate synthase large subunit [Acidimicrobiia bacterium]